MISYPTERVQSLAVRKSKVKKNNIDPAIGKVRFRSREPVCANDIERRSFLMRQQLTYHLHIGGIVLNQKNRHYLEPYFFDGSVTTENQKFSRDLTTSTNSVNFTGFFT